MTREIWQEVQEFRVTIREKIDNMMVTVAMTYAGRQESQNMSYVQLLHQSLQQIRADRDARTEYLPWGMPVVEPVLRDSTYWGEETDEEFEARHQAENQPPIIRVSIVSHFSEDEMMLGSELLEYSRVEANYWKDSKGGVRTEDISIRLSSHHLGAFHPTAVAWGSKPGGGLHWDRPQNLLAVGSSTGTLSMWHYTGAGDPKTAFALVRHTDPLHSSSERCAIVSLTPHAIAPRSLLMLRRALQTKLRWSLDGRSQLATVDLKHKVRTYLMEPQSPDRDAKHSKDAFPKIFSDLPSQTPVMRSPALGSENLVRHKAIEDEEDKSTKKKKKKKKTSIAEEYGQTAEPVDVVFHPSLTAAGTQSSIVIGTDLGPLVKWNYDTVRGSVIYGEPQPKMEPGDPTQDLRALLVQYSAKHTVKREFYEFHTAPIILLTFIDHASLTMLTIDRKGHLGIWPYRVEHFTGFLWFRPSETAVLDMVAHDYIPNNDAMVEVFSALELDTAAVQAETAHTEDDIDKGTLKVRFSATRLCVAWIPNSRFLFPSASSGEWNRTWGVEVLSNITIPMTSRTRTVRTVSFTSYEGRLTRRSLSTISNVASIIAGMRRSCRQL